MGGEARGAAARTTVLPGPRRIGRATWAAASSLTMGMPECAAIRSASSSFSPPRESPSAMSLSTEAIREAAVKMPRSQNATYRSRICVSCALPYGRVTREPGAADSRETEPRTAH